MKSNLIKPTSPGQRGATKRDYSEITTTTPTKSLLSVLTKTGGRNHSGRITVRHIGGGHKRRYRMIDFKRANHAPAEVKSIEYDPNRSANIALLEHNDGTLSYILAPKGLTVGEKLEAGDKVKAVSGNAMMLKNIPTGLQVHNIELLPNQGGTMVRSAGLSATVLAHENNKSIVKLPSGELRRFDSTCYATIGEVSNSQHANIVYAKAGRKRWLGIRPTVRGKAMNPNTHPHGGGEGNTSIGMKYPKTPWGAPALGKRTRDKNNRSSVMIVRRRDK